ncbi:Gastrin-releasing peptide [Liparis tanakae]|uniref:Gastrin-releasing peptide n=1 Tax=Liparis tanakae TaxID=230148 RepID=A0A4Z2J4K6_9TELE|nr:Gastrin-releasing peptide [Liparis tanakae]
MGGVCVRCSWWRRPVWPLLIVLATIPRASHCSDSPAAAVGKMYARGNHWAVGHLMGKKSIDRGRDYLPPSETDRYRDYLPPSETDRYRDYLPPSETDRYRDYLPPSETDQDRDYFPPSETDRYRDYLPPSEPDQDRDYLPPSEPAGVTRRLMEALLQQKTQRRRRVQPQAADTRRLRLRSGWREEDRDKYLREGNDYMFKWCEVDTMKREAMLEFLGSAEQWYAGGGGHMEPMWGRAGGLRKEAGKEEGMDGGGEGV